MKVLLVVALRFIFSNAVFDKGGSSQQQLAQLKADKAQVLKAELKRLERVAGISLAATKSARHTCPDVDVDVDVDIDTDTDRGVSPNCEARWSDGSCIRYGSDRVGECYPNCEARWSDGDCIRYGADICI